VAIATDYEGASPAAELHRSAADMKLSMLDLPRLVAHWSSHGIDLPSGATEEEIRQFESRHNVVLPADMRFYFQAVNGMGKRGVMDEDMFSFWRIQDVISVADELPDRTRDYPNTRCYFMFADHSISLPTYAIRLSSNATENTPVASVLSDFGAFGIGDLFASFTEFVTNYLADPYGRCQTIPEALVPATSVKPWWQFW